MKRIILFLCVLVFFIFSNTNNLLANEIGNNIRYNISNEIQKPSIKEHINADELLIQKDEKLEILEGLSKATKDIKKIIETIEGSENSAEAKSKLIYNFDLNEKQANSVLDMPLKKLTTLEKNQIDDDIKKLQEKKDYFQKLLNERKLLLQLLIEELLLLKKKYNVKRKTKLLKNIDQNEELETINNQIIEDFINKKTKLYIDNRLYLKRMILGNYKKSFEFVNKIIDNKNIQKFICNIDKNIKIIGTTYSGKVFHIDWETNINNDYKLDNKILGNIDPMK